MDEREYSDGENLPDIEEHLYSQVHHERINTNENLNLCEHEQQSKIDDLPRKSFRGNISTLQIVNSKLQKPTEPQMNMIKEFPKSKHKVKELTEINKVNVSKRCRQYLSLDNGKRRTSAILYNPQKIPKLSKQNSRKIAFKANKNNDSKSMDTIEIYSSEEDNDDVVILPVSAVPVYLVDDSDEDEERKQNVAALSIIENAMDAADMQINDKDFVKPTSPTNITEKRVLENSSRCTSPSSVFSTDDFIVQKDRQRLSNTMVDADNEELEMITDINSISVNPTVSISQAKQKNFVNLCVSKTNSYSENKNYRVEQPQFRALDVYESESDIPESVYSKGKQAFKETVIRTISSTDEENCIQDNGNKILKTKRLHKRRFSIGRKNCDTISDEYSSDADDMSSKLATTTVPYISRGPAVERCKHTKQRKTSKSNLVGTETDFIAAINSLAQGISEENRNGIETEEEGSDAENTPTARDIAERVLQKNRTTFPSSNLPTNTNTIEENKERAIPVFDDMEKILKFVDDFNNEELKNDSSNGYNCQNFVKTNGLDKTCELSQIRSSFHYDELQRSRIDQENDNSFNDSISRENKNKNEPKQPNVCINIDSENEENSIERHSPRGKKKENSKIPVYNIRCNKLANSLCGIGWNEEQRRFYTYSWKGENFDIINVCKSMNSNHKLWKISPNDSLANATKYTNNKVKCFNCCQFGHKRTSCHFPTRPRVCRICGDEGHRDINCHNKCCLRCGIKTNSFYKSCNSCLFQNRIICPLCKLRGHSLNNCPDKWRRYHSTIKPNTDPVSSIHYNERVYCYNCGKHGHHGEDCKKENNSVGYPKISSRIRSHEKTYDDKSYINEENGILCNIMYEQMTVNDSFNLVDLAKPRNYYGRFLNAVGLRHLLKKRRLPSVVKSTTSTVKKAKFGGLSREDVHSVSSCISRQHLDTTTTAVDTINLEQQQQSPNISEKEIDVAKRQDALECEINMTPKKENKYEIKNDIKLLLQPSNLRDQPLTTDTVKVSLVMDSDSNYSFSEHFDMSLPHQDSQSLENIKNIGHRKAMGPTPDYIPLESNDNENNLDNDGANHIGYVMDDTDDENEYKNSNTPHNTSLAAKIYLTYQRGKYLSLPEGRKILQKLSTETNITSNLYWSSAGPVITLEGLSTNQDEFHRRLHVQFKDLNSHIRCHKAETSQKMPKRVGVLIRFLIEHFDMLRTNLGNANELHKRLKILDRQDEPSKNSMKNADKLRRQLNMILVGQAGLQKGKEHLQAILEIFQTLKNDYKVEDQVPMFLRDEVFVHWKMIFTSFPYDNYDEMMQNYKNLSNKNYFVTINIDPPQSGLQSKNKV